MTTSTQYLAEEASRQFSQEKHDQIVKQKLGRSKMSPGLQQELTKAQKLAQLKGWNVRECQICGAEVVSKDLREKTILCRNHMGLKSAVSRILSQRKAQNLTKEDVAGMVRTRTVRTGPFFNPIDPTGELRKKGIIK